MNLVTFLATSYERLLTVEVVHGYYPGQYCPHLSLQPSPECAALLRSYRLRYQALPRGGVIIGENPAVVALPNGSMELEFHLRMTNPEFLSVTDRTGMGQGNDSLVPSLHVYAQGNWQAASAVPAEAQLPAGVIGVLRVEAALALGATVALQLPMSAPQVTWKYYVVTGANYVGSLGIAEGSQVICPLPIPPDGPDLATIAARFPGKAIQTLEVTTQLRTSYPAWYLLASVNGGTATHVEDVPTLPKPRPGAAPHLILDYSAILK
ncbi:MAG: hypothetical protein U0176_13880 [Bacteroidia bacterium]